MTHRIRTWLPSSPALAALALAAIVSGQSTTARVSVASNGVPGDRDEYGGVLTADGRQVVFASLATNLVSADTNQGSDVFVHERTTGNTSRVSVDSSGAQANASSYTPQCSADGRYVVFASTATNLVAGDLNAFPDIFLRDRQLGTTEIVSLGAGGIQGDSYSVSSDVSDDGGQVAFSSEATNLVAGDTNGSMDVFVRALSSGTTTRVSLSSGGVQADYDCTLPMISGDGLWVVFESRATTFVTGDTSTNSDIFLRELASDTTSVISEAWGGGLANGYSYRPVITIDGRFIAYFSGASNLVANDTNGGYLDVFVHDRVLATTTIGSLNHNGIQVNGPCQNPTVSDDGRWVAFMSAAHGLAQGSDPTPLEPDAYLRDTLAGTTTLWSVSSTDSPGTEPSYSPVVSADGSSVLFLSEAQDLIAGDINLVWDLFVRDRSFYAPVVSYCTPKLNSLGCPPQVSSAGAPTQSGDDGFRVIAQAEINNKTGIFFWGTTQASLPFGGGILCVQPPLVRSGLMNSGGNASGSSCTGIYSFVFDQAYMQSHSLGAGQTLYGQFWSRDPGFAPPNNIGLTNALAFTIAP